MIIKSLHLENIRSYIKQEFYFKEGMTLLSGDIGSGKSSVLLGIEFALFGLIRGSINGGALLRHGCKDGSVRLSFTINQNLYEVERTIKKTSAGIVQDKCSFSVDGSKEQLTPIELKSKVLNLLGYPDDLVSKSKTLIFRYTVYTPQEEMKKILFEASEERLTKLRRIFGVDKYELIKNNASNYARDLRSELRLHKPLREERDDLRDRIKTNMTELNMLHEENDSLKQKHEIIIKDDKTIKEKSRSLEKDAQSFNELKSKRDVIGNELENLEKNIQDLNRRYENTKKDIEYKEKKLEKIPEIKKSADDIQKEIDEINTKRDEFNNKESEIRSKHAITNNKVQEINDLLTRVDELKLCPTCKQDVKDEHKKSLRDENNEKLKELNERQNKIQEILKKIENNKIKLKDKKTILEKERDEIKSNALKKKLIEQNQKIIQEKYDELKTIQTRNDEMQKKLDTKQKDKHEIKLKLETYKDLEEKIKQTRNEQEEINQKLIDLEKKMSARLQAIKDKDRYIQEKKNTLKQIDEKLNILNEKQITEQWLSNHFVNLAEIIEKNVLSNIHNEFNNLFKDWLSLLIEDREIEANIEQDFSPSIIQNGYDANIENLSGGEKTAISLAYRLSLNKVINDLVHDVKTKGVMILDEPTDGFSSEQLDKVRDVLEKTNTRQIIIVSHEAKLESFVQNIIRINKNNHESKTIQI